MGWTACLFSECGQPPENEDCVLRRCDSGRDAEVIVAADGLGGHDHGARASQLAAEAIAEGFLRAPSLRQDALLALFLQANAAILREHAPGIRMRSTAAALFRIRNEAAAGYIGDTRIYRFRGGKIRYQSTDHSVPQMAVDAGEISPAEIRSHPDRNRLLRALGAQPCRPEIQPLGPLGRGDAFLLCTDGFWEPVTEREMLHALRFSRSARGWMERMSAGILRKAAPPADNCSAIAYRWER